MKSTGNTLQAPVFAQVQKLSIAAISARTKQWLGKLGKRFSHVITELQIGRMQTVLQSMTDEQLARAGVDRSDIRRHAEH